MNTHIQRYEKLCNGGYTKGAILTNGDVLRTSGHILQIETKRRALRLRGRRSTAHLGQRSRKGPNALKGLSGRVREFRELREFKDL